MGLRAVWSVTMRQACLRHLTRNPNQRLGVEQLIAIGGFR